MNWAFTKTWKYTFFKEGVEYYKFASVSRVKKISKKKENNMYRFRRSAGMCTCYVVRTGVGVQVVCKCVYHTHTCIDFCQIKLPWFSLSPSKPLSKC